MKKTLIAIAALAATGAFAQSSVTMSGVVDMAYVSGSAQTAGTAAVVAAPAVMVTDTGGVLRVLTPAVAAKAAVAGADLKINTFDRNGSSTSALNIAGVEDLGGGMKASFFFESNWNPASGGTGTTGHYGNPGSSFAAGQAFLGLDGGFGAVKLGQANSAILQTALTGDSFGTAVGGNYSGRFSSTGNGAGKRVIRNANTLRYDTPSMGGFSASYEMGFANKDLAGTSTTNAGVSVLGLRYAAGPLTVAFATGSLKPAGTVAADAKEAHTLLSANYKLGAATLYAGITGYKATAAGVTGDETSSMNFGVKYQVSGTTSVQASMANRKDKMPVGVGATAANANLLALGADYAMSKRTTAYGRYEAMDTTKASDTAGKSSLLAVGIKHTF